MKKNILISLLGLGLVIAPVASAQTSTIIAQPAPSCLNLSVSLRVGSTDASTGGAVSALQNYLVAQGYFNSAYLGSGRFGALTMRAVMQYQSAHGLPSTGYVGALTRAAISSNCGIVPTPTPAPTPVGG